MRDAVGPDFPILLRLDSSRIDYAKTQDDGDDLRFTDADGNLLAHEVQDWDEDGTSLVWVEAPEIEGGSASSYLYMYYDNASAKDGQDAEGVWDGFTAVWHLDETKGDHDDAGGNDQSRVVVVFVVTRR